MEDDSKVVYHEKDSVAFKIVSSQPHGFWVIERPKGKLSPKLAGKFTSVDEAIKFIENHDPHEGQKEVKEDVGPAATSAKIEPVKEEPAKEPEVKVTTAKVNTDK